MKQSYLCIAIPEQLQEFTIVADIADDNTKDEKSTNNFGVKHITDECGNLIGSAHYSNSGELIKKIFYKGSSVATIEHYRNNHLYSEEKYDTGKIISKTLFNTNGSKLSTIKYKYNRNDQITCIQKYCDNMIYSVEYGYDELKRVNGRKIKVSGDIINEQIYRYDILDRIVEYKDNNQCINVHKINQNNELVSYTITDIVGNKIFIQNKFIYSDYICTEIELNGHKTGVKDRTYLNNVMLKKPYTNEDDLDFTMSNFIKIPKICYTEVIKTKRDSNINTDKISSYIISNKREQECKPPISADNIRLLKL